MMDLKSFLLFLSLGFLFVSCKQTNEDLINKAFNLSKEKKYDEAVKIYSDVIKNNGKLQLAYYNRGFCFMALEKYKRALFDFDKVMDLQTVHGFIYSENKDAPFASEEARLQVPYFDALYQRAQVKFYMDSVEGSFQDFQTLVDNNYIAKSNCILWQGTLWMKSGTPDKGCEYFAKAKRYALTEDEKLEANKMITAYCTKGNNNR